MITEKKQLVAIQYLRAIAALMVVAHHARNPRVWLYNPLEDYKALAYGVDIFFVISGFIMFVAARQENPVDFIGRRIIRVVPLYWIATFSLLALNTNGEFWNIGKEEIQQLVKSLLFIPHYSLTNPEQIWPYLIPGWTLNYEMLFYFIFFCGLLTKHPLLISSITILSMVSVGMFFEPAGAVATTFTDLIMVEFLCGVWIAYLFTRETYARTNSIIILIGFGLLLIPPFFLSGDSTIYLRIISSTMIVTGALLIGKSIPDIRILHLLGDASYSIYLTHTFISIRFTAKLWKLVPLEGWLQFTGWIIVTLIISSIIGVLVHLYIEKPVLHYLRSKWDVHVKNRKKEQISSISAGS